MTLARSMLAAGGLLATASAPAVLAAPNQGDDGSQNRVRDLIYRVRSLDNSERVEEGGEETKVTLAADVLFEFGEAGLTPEAVARLEDLANELADLGPRTVTITGHTDSVGQPNDNQTLSEQRAASVRDELSEQLSEEFSFDVTGQGETEPVAPNENDDGSDNPDGRALNRRVEITYPTS